MLCEVRPSDFGSADPLAGVELQRTWERAAFLAGGGDYRAPAQRSAIFSRESRRRARAALRRRIRSACASARSTAVCRSSCSPRCARRSRSLTKSCAATPCRTRSSRAWRHARPRPVRIVRGETGQSNLRGVYPCGEGRGLRRRHSLRRRGRHPVRRKTGFRSTWNKIQTPPQHTRLLISQAMRGGTFSGQSRNRLCFNIDGRDGDSRPALP